MDVSRATRTWDLEKDLDRIRSQFPILGRCTYLISNSLGAVPRGVRQALERYYTLWAEEGVSAWSSEWWDLARRVGDLAASLIGAGPDEVTMLTSATNAHWAALSTAFNKNDPRRNRVIMTDLDFPSTIYAVSRIAKFMGWDIDMIESQGRPGIEWEEVAKRIDDRTLCVAVSHVFFKSAFILDVRPIAREARLRGAFTLIDGYHGPGTIPVDVKSLEVNFYVGGCLKWLCGGPGNAFLYANPDPAGQDPPLLTGWLGHRSPFRFEKDMEYTQGAYRFMSGTPPIPSLYTAVPGMEIIQGIGIAAIREKSLRQTGAILREAQTRGFQAFTPNQADRRGGAVSLGLPHAYQVKQALEKRGVKVDFRKGGKAGSDVIRIGPHFYTRDEEIHTMFQAADDILATGEYQDFPENIDHVT
ncbi:aminotransferase class V-fold PLP-dependent enzyme [Acidobacteriota bacterium]